MWTVIGSLTAINNVIYLHRFHAYSIRSMIKLLRELSVEIHC